MNENEERKNVAYLASLGDGSQYLQGTGFWGLTTMLLMSRAGASHLLDTTTLTSNPKKVVAWFLLGASIAAYCNFTKFKASGYDRHTYTLHRRVAENE